MSGAVFVPRIEKKTNRMVKKREQRAGESEKFLIGD
jgi:hypothetical protein